MATAMLRNRSGKCSTHLLSAASCIFHKCTSTLSGEKTSNPQPFIQKAKALEIAVKGEPARGVGILRVF